MPQGAHRTIEELFLPLTDHRRWEDLRHNIGGLSFPTWSCNRVNHDLIPPENEKGRVSKGERPECFSTKFLSCRLGSGPNHFITTYIAPSQIPDRVRSG